MSLPADNIKVAIIWIRKDCWDHLLAITISDRHEGDSLEKEGTGRRALAELDDLSGLTNFT